MSQTNEKNVESRAHQQMVCDLQAQINRKHMVLIRYYRNSSMTELVVW
jgi:hypothetical protein